MEGMDANTIMQFIGALGFPIACCVYLISNMGKKLDKLTEVINNNNKLVEKMLDRLDRDGE